ncbi:SpoIID/LytB domain-containing protein [Roseisolibacter sp. H3M3-2]|uniref:SpoIID/LytB domain-containing protein n=1 Tax=Roseisolibacter sp. H3M3-2 TaxID=3031323 RepID=UPI0023D9FD2C|nr:SpoIID/LytB domain-containing protein [Roseisolibacter sp. H3M3-2]MDF1503097.1 SpoIID/LytB domain-containing protein [Roseisolibacter sp. H3M3-2]
MLLPSRTLLAGATLVLAATLLPGGARPAAAGAVPADAARDDGGRLVRIALAVGVDAPRVAATGAWRLADAAGRPVARAADGEGWTIERSGTRLRAVGPDGPTAWRDGMLVAQPIGLGAFLTYGPRRYRGELRLHAAEGGVTVVNALPVEEYLRGVVPLELNAFAPAEAAALEAQAVAARSYTYSRLPEFLPRAQAEARASHPFDLRATVADQVYGGADAERPASDRAVRATSGLVLRFGGMVVSAPYYSACGGSTAASGEAFGGEGQEYLRPVSDRIPGTDRHWCDPAPRFRWTRSWEGDDLQGVMERYLRRYASGDAARAAGAPVGTVRGLVVQGHSASGRVASLAVSTDGGRYVVRSNEIRYVLRSVGGEILPSTYFSVDAAVDADGRVSRLTLRGNGNGHGVGMCQWGAIGRARAGHDFRSILRTYYPGTTVEFAE